ncbi:MFS transporter [Mucilaginibacter terrae]|uniref:UMF1 family MFS transporter n=1 Tax=Mucilaginibacter terrae TaxID=1955052 RepID=A0ABU3GPQ5_9SPHI|nr:MFS transporter [Mucilaginibacter terrae]MDT3400942.1 UMF1 family MFS transporter [Mucilaginibacter terrae]
METKNDPKTIRAWAMFDWANSAYNLVITSTIFPAYYAEITTSDKHADRIMFLGREFINTALLDYVLSAAYMIVVLLLPILTSIADYRGNKKSYMQFFTWMGALACCGLFFFKADTLEVSLLFCALAAIGYCSGTVFYNSYLPQIATLEEQDRVSAKGFTYGYIGSVLLQIICFVFIFKPEWFGIPDKAFAARLSFLLVGAWWLAFAQIPFLKLPKGQPNNTNKYQNVLTGGFIELRHVWNKIKNMPVLKRYLSAFFFYSMGVQTIMLVATGFAAKELKLPKESLIITILIIQLVAIAGAALMSKLSSVYGNIKVLMGVVMIWIGVCFAAYFTQNQTQFYLLAVVVGLVMGGIQSLSRSTYSKFLPQNITDTASFFSFYDVTEKLAIVIGLFTFGFVESLTGSMRNSTLVLSVFFIAGLLLLFLLLCTQKREIENITPGTV